MAVVFSDNFNRANGDITAEANWDSTNSSPWSIASNQLSAGSGGTIKRLITTTSAHAAIADCKVSIVRRLGANFDGGISVRDNGADVGTETCYFLNVYGTNNIEVYRRVSGAETLIGSITQTHADGDTYTLEVSGTGATVTLRVYRNGSLLNTFTDTSGSRITSSGRCAVITFHNGDLFDDFLVEDLAGGSASVTGTGALAAPTATVSGTGVRHVSGGGALVTPIVTISGSGVRRIAGSGALTVPGAVASGTGVRRVAGPGALTAPVPTVSGSQAPEAISGTGSLVAPAAAVSGSGVRGADDVGGAVQLLAPVPAVSGVGTVNAAGNHITGSGALTGPKPAVGGGGVRRVTGSGAILSSVPTVAGAGVRRISGSGALSAPKPAVSGFEGAQIITGSGALTAPTSAVAGTGARGSRGSGALSGSAPSVSGAAAKVQHISGSGALAAPRPIVRGTNIPTSPATRTPVLAVEITAELWKRVA